MILFCDTEVEFIIEVIIIGILSSESTYILQDVVGNLFEIPKLCAKFS